MPSSRRRWFLARALWTSSRRGGRVLPTAWWYGPPVSGSSPRPVSGPHPADRHRDPATVARVTAVAAEILVRHGVDPRTARRAHGWSNMTWLAGGFAIRIAA